MAARSAGPAVAARERRRRPQGERRRAELLAALDALLAERPVEAIEIADITDRAGVARSLFYFYFPSKAAAVVALLEDVLAEVTGAAARWCRGGGAADRPLLEPGIADIVAVWRGHAREILALLEAVRGESGAHRQWVAWSADCAAHIAARIARDRDAGLVCAEVDATGLATALTSLTLAEMERDVRAIGESGEPVAGLAEALVHIWDRAIYT
jgi:AcrR family transcriptional regulator